MGLSILVLLFFQTGYAGSKPRQPTFSFAGQEWEAETSLHKTINPGENYFSSSEESLWVDQNGWLHLKIHGKEGRQKWTCASVHSIQPARYGTHRFRVIGNLGSLDKNVVLGLFLYKVNQQALQEHAEVDIEFSAWGFPQENQDGTITAPCSNAQMVLWPDWCGEPSPLPAFMKHYTLHQTQTTISTHDIHWREGYLHLSSYWYSDMTPREEDLIASCEVTPETNPSVYFPIEEDQMLLNINLWLNNLSDTTSDGQPVEVIVHYEYIPEDKTP